MGQAAMELRLYCGMAMGKERLQEVTRIMGIIRHWQVICDLGGFLQWRQEEVVML